MKVTDCKNDEQLTIEETKLAPSESIVWAYVMNVARKDKQLSR